MGEGLRGGPRLRGDHEQRAVQIERSLRREDLVRMRGVEDHEIEHPRSRAEGLPHDLGREARPTHPGEDGSRQAVLPASPGELLEVRDAFLHNVVDGEPA